MHTRQLLQCITAQQTTFIYMFAASLVLFATWPTIDIWVASLFYQPIAGFAVSQSALANGLRHSIWAFVILMFLVSCLSSAAPAKWHTWTGVPRTLWLYCVALYICGPVVLVNYILKGYVGRARPAQTELFGGDSQFSPAFQVVAECPRNCSFVSGEAAGAVTMALCVWVLTMVGRKTRWTTFSRLVAIAMAVVAAGLRVAKGRHFLSDVWFAAILMMGVAIALALLWQIPWRRPDQQEQ